MVNSLIETFGEIDIYLFDQLLKGRFDSSKIILDAGCGYGRNIIYFLKNNYQIFGVDVNAEAIDEVKKFVRAINSNSSLENFLVSSIENMPFSDATFDVVISSAVLHFVSDRNHFDKMVRSCWRVLKPGGYFFARLASNIGIESLTVDLGNGRFLLPDGSERYLVDQNMLLEYTRLLHGELFEPIKTTNVQNLRCMTTWCVRKF